MCQDVKTNNLYKLATSTPFKLSNIQNHLLLNPTISPKIIQNNYRNQIRDLSMLKTSTLGYPRMGKNRELKFALEAYWKKTISLTELQEKAEAVEKENLLLQKSKNVDIIPINDFSYYDQMLDLSVALGVIPDRFQQETFSSTFDLYFGIARGTEKNVASEMTKWFNTNYHYIVPELDSTIQQPRYDFIKRNIEIAKETGITAKPVLIGLLTYILLGKKHKRTLNELVNLLLPNYLAIIGQFNDAGFEWIQIDEPVLVTERTAEEKELLKKIFAKIKDTYPNLKIFLQTYFESLTPNYQLAVNLPVDGIGLDFTVNIENFDLLKKEGFPKDKVLGLGIIDGRNIWKSNLQEKIALVEEITSNIPDYHVILQPSTSLQFSPNTLASEQKLDTDIKQWLAFAEEKLDELALLKTWFTGNKESIKAQLDDNKKALAARKTSSKIHKFAIKDKIKDNANNTFQRTTPFAERKRKQQEFLQLPLLPTTTIGSFPQTQEVRTMRKKFRAGEINKQEYDAFINKETESCIRAQEEIGLDVLVHGEFERNDMVEFFGENLAGFTFTEFGWVQSYGSRCVKPPVIFGDVERTHPMTVEMAKYANNLSKKEVKGMLTGPITIIGWSFVRDDQPLSETALQIAFALRDEVLDLEAAGIRVIQIDEPALRERLPLRKDKQPAYINWAVNSFRATCAEVEDETQIHTHMCYSYFNDIIDAIQAMDADCISIENSRSDLEMLEIFKTFKYKNDIGLGIYDIHSPRVPSVEDMLSVINESLKVVPKEQFWINPDCGLKTRGWEETIAALKNMVEAARKARS